MKLGTIRCCLLLLAMGVSTASAGVPRPPQHAHGSAAATDEMTRWFSQPKEQRGDIPDPIEQLPPLSRDSVEAATKQVWTAYEQAAIALGRDKALPKPTRIGSRTKIELHELKTGAKVMPFVFLDKATTRNRKRPLFIALHGGGSAGGSAPSPHGWPVNTREWQAQIQLAQRLYPRNALYFVPRMADDNDGRWYFNYCQDAYQDVIRQAILFHNVDPNRVYLIGISEGAYTAYRLGSMMADRWAGAGSMAGGEPLQNAPPENMRNMAFRADIGERDTMFDRIGLNRRFGAELAKLQKNDPEGYVHKIKVQARRGHGIDYEPCPKWIYQHKRNPWPTRVVWKIIQVHGRHQQQFYWLALNQPPTSFPLRLDARVDRRTNTISITAERPVDGGQYEAVAELPSLRVYLNDQLVDLNQPVTIVCNQRQVFQGRVDRRVSTLMRSVAERGDPCYAFPAAVDLGSK